MRKGWLLLFSLVLFGTSVLVGQKVTVDFNHSANFSNYHTYAWLKPVQAPGLWPQRITDGVTAELRAKGLTYNPTNPDLMVAAMGASSTKRSLNTFYSGTGGGWGWHGGYGMGTATATTTVNEYKQGTVVVDLFDTKNKQLVWRGVATDTASGNPEKNQKKMTKALEKMFKKYPPKAAE